MPSTSGTHTIVIDSDDTNVVNDQIFQVERWGGTPGADELLTVHESGEVRVYGPIHVASGPVIVRGEASGQAVARLKAGTQPILEVSQTGVGKFPVGVTLPTHTQTADFGVLDGSVPGEVMNIVILDPAYVQVPPITPGTYLAVWHGGKWRGFVAS